MRWLLLIFIFEVDRNGDVGEPVTATRLFDSQAACDRAGQNLREQVPIPENLKSLSVCIPEDFSRFQSDTETR